MYIWGIQERVQSANRDEMKGSYLGPEFSEVTIREALDKCGAKYHLLERSDLIDCVATYLSEEKAIGWMQGRMEFGHELWAGEVSSQIHALLPCKSN